MKKKIVLVDIDGTISKVGDRLKYLEQSPKDWDSFYEACFEDEPVTNIIDLVKNLERNYDIIFCTGRRESIREKTNKWIGKYINGHEYIWPLDNRLLMRENGDFRHDIITKPESLIKANIKLEEIAFVIEDRNSMVAKWRELGLICLQPADGDF